MAKETGRTGIAVKYKSSALRCHDGEDDCPICEFLSGSQKIDDLLRVIEVLDAKLATAEDTVFKLAGSIAVASAASTPRCAKCHGSGQVQVPGSWDYRDCPACDGKGF